MVDAGPMFCFAFAGSCLIVLGLVSIRRTVYMIDNVA